MVFWESYWICLCVNPLLCAHKGGLWGTVQTLSFPSVHSEVSLCPSIAVLQICFLFPPVCPGTGEPAYHRVAKDIEKRGVLRCPNLGSKYKVKYTDILSGSQQTFCRAL